MSTDVPSSHMSHELRTPLNHIIGYCELLLEDADDRKQTALIEPLQQMRLCGKQLVTLLTAVFAKDVEESSLARLVTAQADLLAVVVHIRQISSVLAVHLKNRGLNDFMADLKKIETATDNFVGLINQYVTERPAD